MMGMNAKVRARTRASNMDAILFFIGRHPAIVLCLVVLAAGLIAKYVEYRQESEKD